MTDDRTMDRELTTADVAAASERISRGESTGSVQSDQDRPMSDREVPLSRENSTAADFSANRSTPLLPHTITEELRTRWTEIQTEFVDEPRRSVERADALVADAITRLAESFASARATLEREWDRGDDISTEDFRQALQRYRAFFSRLLEV